MSLRVGLAAVRGSPKWVLPYRISASSGRGRLAGASGRVLSCSGNRRRILPLNSGAGQPGRHLLRPGWMLQCGLGGAFPKRAITAWRHPPDVGEFG